MRLRVGGVNWRGQDAQPAGVVDWKPVLAAAGLDETQFTPTDPAWWHYPFRFDALAAWQGPAGGGRTYRVEAAAYRGRVAYFGLWLDAIPQPPPPPQATWLDLVPKMLGSIGDVAVPLLTITLIAALAALARHNLRTGRGDRKGAWRVAMFTLVSLLIAINVPRRWGSDVISVYNALVFGQGQPLFWAVSGWLSYLGFEPFVRRRWPQLLVTSTRLLDGRWRDPLVGRSVLVGVVAGIVFFGVDPLAALASRLPGMGPVRTSYAQ